MQACLKNQLGRNIQVYVDDTIVKTKEEATLLDDLHDTFDNLDRYRIKLNPDKCAFGVPSGQLLGYLISAKGIKVNPKKIKALLAMEKPKNIRGVQQHKRCPAAGWENRGAQSIHQSNGRKGTALLPTPPQG